MTQKPFAVLYANAINNDADAATIASGDFEALVRILRKLGVELRIDEWGNAYVSKPGAYDLSICPLGD